MKKFILWAFLTTTLVGGGFAGYRYWTTSQAVTPQQMPAQAVDVITVGMRQINPEVSYVAKIEAMDKVGLRARVTGFLQEQLFKDGDLVTKDQPLFLIEKVNFEAQVRQAEANLEKAKASAVNAKAQYNRTQTLFKTKDVSAAKLDEARAANDAAQATVSEMKARLDLAQKDLEYTTIVAPMDGRIGESTFSVGELIGPSSGILAEVVSINPIDAVFSVSENDITRLQDQFGNGADTDVTFIFASGKTYPEKGSINFVDIALDEAMNTLKMKASFPNPDNRLISGQYGRVVLRGTKPIDQIVIPMKAVQRDMTGAYVYLVDADNKIVKQSVQTGLELPNFDVVIENGLRGGETLVTAGFQKITAGATVQPVAVQ
jgi:membrane fusion protein (multidrug efflux system)